jgi:hypothetical protein
MARLDPVFLLDREFFIPYNLSIKKQVLIIIIHSSKSNFLSLRQFDYDSLCPGSLNKVLKGATGYRPRHIPRALKNIQF